MPKRKRRPRAVGPPRQARAKRRPVQQRGREEGPDLLRDVALALDDPFTLLSLVSSLVAALDPRSRNPFETAPQPGAPSRSELLQTFFEVDLPETSALLAVIAELDGDDVLRRRVHREIATRAHVLPQWLLDLARTQTTERVVEMGHVLGDGDNIMLGVRLPEGTEFSIVIYVDHNLGTLVKDAFVVPEPLPRLVGLMRATAEDPDTTFADLDPADARARITEAIELGAITVPPLETDTWPGCRPLVEWAVRRLPSGGTGYQRPEWNDQARQALTERFFGSPLGAGLDDADHRSLLESLLWFGTDYGPGDPLRWSPVNVELLLADWLPRKVIADASFLSLAPGLLRAFIRFSHAERGIRPSLTAQTLAAVDEYEPGYLAVIRSPRPQGPAALLAALGALGPDDRFALQEAVTGGLDQLAFDGLRATVGGERALEQLDAEPLPDEPFDWSAVPADVHDRVAEVLALTDGCCNELLDVEYRTACRRLLARAAAGDPEVFRRRSRAETAAAAVCWIIGKANHLFDRGGMPVKDLMGHFGQRTASTRSQALLKAIGVDPHQPYGVMFLGSSDYLTSSFRARIIAARARLGTAPADRAGLSD